MIVVIYANEVAGIKEKEKCICKECVGNYFFVFIEKSKELANGVLVVIAGFGDINIGNPFKPLYPYSIEG